MKSPHLHYYNPHVTKTRRRAAFAFIFPSLIAILSFSIGVLVGSRVTSTTRDVSNAPILVSPPSSSADDWCNFMPGPQTFDTPDFINEKGCVLGEVLPVRRAGSSARRLPSPDLSRSLKERLYCSDRAGKGKWRKDGSFVWDEATRCGFRWFTPEETCELLSGHTVFFMGDSTSRRLAMTLKSMLGGLKAAATASREDEALIPDLFSRFTDGVARCVPSQRGKCDCVRVAGVGKPEQWESLKVVTTQVEDHVVSSEDGDAKDSSPPNTVLHEAESPQDEQSVTWKSFYIPYVTQFAAQLKTWAPMLVDFANGIPNAQSMIEQAERMTSRQRTVVVANFGSWHLQSPLAPMVVAKGHKDPYNRAGAGRNKPVKVPTSYISTERFKGKMRAAMDKARQSRRTLWVWRTTAPVNSSSPRFARADSVSANSEGLQPIVTKHGHPYLDVDDVIDEWNNVSSREAASAGWLVAEVNQALARGGRSTLDFLPRIDDMGYIHLRDAGRRLVLQIILNVLYQHIPYLREGIVSSEDSPDYRRTW